MKKSIKKETEFFEKLHKLCDEYNVVQMNPSIVCFYERWNLESQYKISIDTELPFSATSGNILELIYEKSNIKNIFTSKNKCLRINKSKSKNK